MAAQEVLHPGQGFGGRGAAAAACGGPAAIVINLAVYDPLLGKTYAEIGTEARSMHKCQGMAQLLALPGPSNSVLSWSSRRFAGGMTQRDRHSSTASILDRRAGAFAGPRPPRELTRIWRQWSARCRRRRKRFDDSADGAEDATLQPLLDGLRGHARLRAQLRTMPIPDDGRFEIEFRLRQKEREFQQAILLANGVRVEALADDGVVVPGQPVRLSIVLANRGARR